MKTNVLVMSIFMALLFGTMTSAEEADAWFLEVEMGASFPVGAFGDSDIESDDAGLAQTGFMGGVSGRFALEDGFGVYGTYTVSIHGFDSDTRSDFIDDASAAFPTLDWSLATTSWIVNGVFVGPYIATTASNFELILKGGIGIIVANSPEIELTASDGVNSRSVVQPSAVGVGFGYQIAGIAHYRFSDLMTAYVGLSFHGGETNHGDVETRVTSNGTTESTSQTSFKQNIAVMNIPLGVSFSF